MAHIDLGSSLFDVYDNETLRRVVWRDGKRELVEVPDTRPSEPPIQPPRPRRAGRATTSERALLLR